MGGGGDPRTPPITAPVITEEGPADSGTHTYCYIVFSADALDGISAGSAPSCAQQEPAQLRYDGTYNALSTSYAYPLAALLWYRSKDGGPYQLFTINGTMDVGQKPRSFGGWPLALPGDTLDISRHEDLIATVTSVSGNRITINRPLDATVRGTLVDHDDTLAVQSAIDAASDKGGGEIYFPPGTYNLRDPVFGYKFGHNPNYISVTRDYQKAMSWSTWGFIHLPNGSPGHLQFVGSGPSTVLQMPPNAGGQAALFSSEGVEGPQTSPYKAYSIEPVDKGATEITLTSAPPPSIAAGTDIWIYGGSFGTGLGPGCVDKNGSPGGNCHFSEPNTVVGVNGRRLRLEYPTSKRYYDDGTNSFGIVPLPICPHDISLTNMTINANNKILGVAVMYGMLVDHVDIHGAAIGGMFGGGPKRDVVIENSEWEIGEGDASWRGTDEFDQAVGLALIDDHVTGLVAKGAEGPSLNARLYLTEGTSDVFILDNTFDHFSVYTMASTDDYIEDNTFHDGNIAIGSAYRPDKFSHDQAGTDYQNFISFGSQTRAVVSGNTFRLDSDFSPPWGIRIGHYGDAVVSGNTIEAAGNVGGGAGIMSYSGAVENNKVIIDRGTEDTVGILLVPDYGPGVNFSSFDVADNTIRIGGEGTPIGIGIVGPRILDSEPVCIRDNDVDVGKGKREFVWNAENIISGCTSNGE